MRRTAILEKIAAEVGGGDLVFPTSVQVALKLQRAIDDPDCHIDLAANLIRAEPLLASRVVAVANSVAFNRSGREVTDVRTAVARLGFRTIRSLAAGIVARQLAGDRSAESRALASQLWKHTAQVAALARVIAQRLTHQDPETAMFAGIVHEVGSFYLISRADEYPELLQEELSSEDGDGEALIGRAVLSVLGVPDAVVEAIEVCWRGYLAMPPSSLGDTLLLAKELSPVPSPLHRGADVVHQDEEGQIEAVIGQEILSEILAASEAEVTSIAAALGS